MKLRYTIPILLLVATSPIILSLYRAARAANALVEGVDPEDRGRLMAAIDADDTSRVLALSNRSSVETLDLMDEAGLLD